jgi:hypothetical protein
VQLYGRIIVVLACPVLPTGRFDPFAQLSIPALRHAVPGLVSGTG